MKPLEKSLTHRQEHSPWLNTQSIAPTYQGITLCHYSIPLSVTAGTDTTGSDEDADDNHSDNSNNNSNNDDGDDDNDDNTHLILPYWPPLTPGK